MPKDYLQAVLILLQCDIVYDVFMVLLSNIFHVCYFATMQWYILLCCLTTVRKLSSPAFCGGGRVGLLRYCSYLFVIAWCATAFWYFFGINCSVVAKWMWFYHWCGEQWCIRDPNLRDRDLAQISRRDRDLAIKAETWKFETETRDLTYLWW